ncbi:MAG: tRNA (guanosine(37)-N1)-methyltransferase TrmD [Gammaproteobacteria bacterium]|nr:tRNA (guanosine(37)-N1)-methyltransferase TrmD [Gammaproteobacteria bacterium]
MEIGIITLFPEMFDALNYGVIRRAIEKKIIHFKFFNPRYYTQDKRKTVDDRPYGGGPGMLMKVAPLRAAISDAKKQSKTLKTKVLYVSPKGKNFDQSGALTLSQRDAIIFVAGRYEGIDERVLMTDIDEVWSIGDFVLTGGELAVMCMIDAITRLLPDVLGDEQSAIQDSFSNGLLDCPHYTRPEVIDGLKVPKILLSGNHQAIERWRLKQALGQTWKFRPDLLKKRKLTLLEQTLLNEFINEQS